MPRRSTALLLVGLVLPLLAWAAPVAPEEPAGYHVRIRYRIDAFRTERLRQFKEMTDYLRKVGFERDPDEVVAEDEADNPRATRMSGTIPAGGLPRLLRQRHIRSVLAYPKEAKLPDKGTRVRVEVQLVSGYLPDVQARLHAQTAAVLAGALRFVEGFRYDHRASSRLVGSVPVESLDKLLEDPRTLKGAGEEGAPFRNIPGIRLTVARPDWPAPAGFPPAPVVPEKERKLTPDLRRLLADPGRAGVRTRLEVILGWTPRENDQGWQRNLALPGVTIEGQLGPLVTVFGIPRDIATQLAALDVVAHVRLPRPARVPERVSKDLVSTTWEPLSASGVAQLHRLGRRGRGTRLALIADDFSGWEKLKGRKEDGKFLPDPFLFDMTVERNREMVADPFPLTGRAGPSPATRCAALLLRAAPEAELTLIRIDPAMPYMLQEVARAINGEAVFPISLAQRLQDLRTDRANLDDRARELTDERRNVYSRVREDEQWLKRRETYQTRQATYDRDEAAYKRRQGRYFAQLRDLRGLRGIRVVASTLVWSEGHPVDGSSALSRYFDDRPFRAALWFQAAGDTNGQAWSGLFRDEDRNGFMEFNAPGERLPVGQWSPEMNFLGWQPSEAATPRQELPANARVRISLQWREAHDALPLRVGEDPYREPLTRINLVVALQPDPQGKGRPSDDLQVVAQSGTVPTRLDQTRNAATYEHTVELTVPKAGRYAVFIQGKLPQSVLAPGENRLPGARKFGEVRPRLFVHTLQGEGRAVWTGFVSMAAALGMPADARTVITVAAADEKDRIRPSSAGGSPHNLSLCVKPDILSYDNGGGTSQAASFAAGVVGSAWPTTGTIRGVLDGLRIKPGDVLRLPPPRGK